MWRRRRGGRLARSFAVDDETDEAGPFPDLDPRTRARELAEAEDGVLWGDRGDRFEDDDEDTESDGEDADPSLRESKENKGTFGVLQRSNRVRRSLIAREFIRWRTKAWESSRSHRARSTQASAFAACQTVMRVENWLVGELQRKPGLVVELVGKRKGAALMVMDRGDGEPVLGRREKRVLDLMERAAPIMETEAGEIWDQAKLVHEEEEDGGDGAAEFKDLTDDHPALRLSAQLVHTRLLGDVLEAYAEARPDLRASTIASYFSSLVAFAEFVAASTLTPASQRGDVLEGVRALRAQAERYKLGEARRAQAVALKRPSGTELHELLILKAVAVYLYNIEGHLDRAFRTHWDQAAVEAEMKDPAGANPAIYGRQELALDGGGSIAFNKAMFSYGSPQKPELLLMLADPKRSKPRNLDDVKSASDFDTEDWVFPFPMSEPAAVFNHPEAKERNQRRRQEAVADRSHVLYQRFISPYELLMAMMLFNVATPPPSFPRAMRWIRTGQVLQSAPASAGAPLLARVANSSSSAAFIFDAATTRLMDRLRKWATGVDVRDDGAQTPSPAQFDSYGVWFTGHVFTQDCLADQLRPWSAASGMRQAGSTRATAPMTDSQHLDFVRNLIYKLRRVRDAVVLRESNPERPGFTQEGRFRLGRELRDLAIKRAEKRRQFKASVGRGRYPYYVGNDGTINTEASPLTYRQIDRPTPNSMFRSTNLFFPAGGDEFSEPDWRRLPSARAIRAASVSWGLGIGEDTELAEAAAQQAQQADALFHAMTIDDAKGGGTAQDQINQETNDELDAKLEFTFVRWKKEWDSVLGKFRQQIDAQRLISQVTGRRRPGQLSFDTRTLERAWVTRSFMGSATKLFEWLVLPVVVRAMRSRKNFVRGLMLGLADRFPVGGALDDESKTPAEEDLDSDWLKAGMLALQSFTRRRGAELAQRGRSRADIHEVAMGMLSFAELEAANSDFQAPGAVVTDVQLNPRTGAIDSAIVKIEGAPAPEFSAMARDKLGAARATKVVDELQQGGGIQLWTRELALLGFMPAVVERLLQYGPGPGDDGAIAGPVAPPAPPAQAGQPPAQAGPPPAAPAAPPAPPIAAQGDLVLQALEKAWEFELTSAKETEQVFNEQRTDRARRQLVSRKRDAEQSLAALNAYLATIGQVANPANQAQIVLLEATLRGGP